MIDGTKANGDTFASLTYNAKRNSANEESFFFRNEAAIFSKETGEFINNITMTRLTNLNRIYVLTSRSTASASEMIINGLRPSFGDNNIIIIGTTTVGKNEGSFTVVDAPANSQNQIFTNTDNMNPNHTVGLQPIVFQIFNSAGESDYSEGFNPDIFVDELEFTANILPFGDTNEPLLRTAINNITGAVTKSLEKPTTKVELLEKVKFEKFHDELYTIPEKDKFDN